MRPRVTHLACLLLLLSSLALSDVRAGGGESARTPGGVFVRNLLLQAKEDGEPEQASFEHGTTLTADAYARPLPLFPVHDGNRPSMQTARVHAVTGSSL